jgi:voltage-gated potassium channel Kch
MEPREHPAEQAQAVLLAPAVGIAPALIDAGYLLRPGDHGENQIADREGESQPLHSVKLALERGAADANITSIPDGLWRAMTIVTTVGYGDTFPVTAAGRAFAVVLMLVGVGLFGLLATPLASFFIERGRHEEARLDDIGLEDISLRLERIERTLEELGSERRETGSRGQKT